MEKTLQQETKDFISLKVDFAFKHVMKNKKVLRGLLGTIFEISPEEITDIEFRDTSLTKSASDGKQGILDVRITVNRRKHINIELQINYFQYWKNRTMFYNFKMFVDQGRSGSKYKEFNPCIHISILDFNLFPDSGKFHSKIQLLDTENHQLYTDKIAFHVIELKKVKSALIEAQGNELYHWCMLINAKSREEYEMLANKNEYLKEAVDEIQKINRDRALREEYLKRKMAIMDEESQKDSYFEAGLKKGVEQGLEQGKIENAIYNVPHKVDTLRRRVPCL